MWADGLGSPMKLALATPSLQRAGVRSEVGGPRKAQSEICPPMKRLHVHMSVADLDQSIRFYSTLFAAEPTVKKPETLARLTWREDRRPTPKTRTVLSRPRRCHVTRRCTRSPRRRACAALNVPAPDTEFAVHHSATFLGLRRGRPGSSDPLLIAASTA